MKTFFMHILYANFFSILLLTIGYGVANIFGFTLAEFWEGYLIATGSYIGIELYQAKHYKLVERRYEHEVD